MPLRHKNKMCFLRFRHTVKFPVSPSNLKNLTASPGVERARKPSVYFFGTFFVQAKKVHIVSHPHGSQEGAHTLCTPKMRTQIKVTVKRPPLKQYFEKSFCTQKLTRVIFIVRLSSSSFLKLISYLRSGSANGIFSHHSAAIMPPLSK